MAIGLHWEWRGFGDIPVTMRALIAELPPQYEVTNWLVTDRYLWTPSATVNLKLRYQALKVKRPVATEGVFERWLEAEDDIYPFPLTMDVVTELCRHLGVDPPAGQPDLVHESEMISWLAAAEPPVHLIEVQKHRGLHQWEVEAGAVVGLELSLITRPQLITTLALEHEDLALVMEAWRQLALDDLTTLRPLNYMQVLARWAGGEMVP